MRPSYFILSLVLGGSSLPGSLLPCLHAKSPQSQIPIYFTSNHDPEKAYVQAGPFRVQRMMDFLGAQTVDAVAIAGSLTKDAVAATGLVNPLLGFIPMAASEQSTHPGADEAAGKKMVDLAQQNAIQMIAQLDQGGSKDDLILQIAGRSQDPLLLNDLYKIAALNPSVQKRLQAVDYIATYKSADAIICLDHLCMLPRSGPDDEMVGMIAGDELIKMGSSGIDALQWDLLSAKTYHRLYAMKALQMEKGNSLETAKSVVQSVLKMLQAPSGSSSFKDEQISPLQREAWIKLLSWCQDNNMDNPFRYSYDTLASIVRNRQNGPAVGHPMAVLIMPKADHNNAFFTADETYIAPLIREGYSVMLYEAGTVDDLTAALQSATAGKKASVIVFAGHGTMDSLQLGYEKVTKVAAGPGGPAAQSLTQILVPSLTTGSDKEMNPISGSLAPGGQIILSSCSTGKGEALSDNLANFLRKVFPQAKQAGIWAPTDESAISKVDFDPQGEITNVHYVGPPNNQDVKAYRAYTERLQELQAPPDFTDSSLGD